MYDVPKSDPYIAMGDNDSTLNKISYAILNRFPRAGS
jgi:hypothetical protein